MAKAMEDFTLKRRGRTGEEVDWNTYFDGKVYELKEGVDFESKIATFRQKASREARERGGSVETRADADTGLLQIRFSKISKK